MSSSFCSSTKISEFLSLPQPLPELPFNFLGHHDKARWTGTSRETVGTPDNFKISSGSSSAQDLTDSNKTPFTLGRIVSLIFFWGDHLMHDVPQGPFQNSYDWLHARLTFVLNDNEGVDSLYWEHLLEYEQTKLRRLFLTEMEQLQPDWVEELKRGVLKADFEKAVHNADNGFCFKIIRGWLDAYSGGEIYSLRKRMLE